MPRPEYSSNALQVANDATFATQGDAFDGTPTKATPALSLITQGARPARQMAARVRNWIDREIASVLSALIADTALLQDDAMRLKSASVLNFNTFAANTFSLTGVWDNFNRRLWAARLNGTTPELRISDDMGQGAVTANALTGGTAGDTPFDMATDDSGNVVMSVIGSRFVYEVNAALSGSRADTTQTTASATSGAGIAWEANTNRFVWACYDPAVPDVRVRYSTNRTVWTLATTHPVFSPAAPISQLRIAAKRSANRLMVVGISNVIRCATSDDGGSTWTMRTAPSPSSVVLATSPNVRLIYDDVSDAWYVIVGGIAASGGTEVFRSTNDGSTWTKVGALGAFGITGLAVVGQLLVGLSTPSGGARSEIVYSLDNGATWRPSGHRFPAAGGNLVKTPLGVVALIGGASGGLYFSDRVGLATAAVLT